MVSETRAPLRAGWRRVAPVVLLAALPWVWFAVRDVLGVVGDVIAIAIPVLAVSVAVLTLLVSWWWPRALVLGLSALLAGGVAVVGPWVPADRGAVAAPGVTIAGANVDNTLGPAAALRALPADVLVVAELPPGMDDELASTYPHRVDNDSGTPSVGVFSRYPLRVLEGSGPDLPGLRVQVDGPSGPFVLYALHIPRPWFTTEGGYQASVSEHFEFAERIAERVRAETQPTVVVGDLNSTDRGRDYRTLVRTLDDAMLADWGAPTSVGKWLPLLGRIDHVLVGEGWCGDDPRRTELPGSSHRAVLATVGPCAQP